MLAFFRKKKKGLKWILWVVILALGAGMVLLFVNTPGSVSGQLSAQDVARVGDRPISVVEYRKQYGRLYDMYRQMYRLDQQDPEIVKQLGIGRQALSQLINEYAIVHAARQIGLGASAEEITRQISSLPAFQEGGRFIGVQRYEQILEANNMTAVEFEEGIRRDIVREKLRHLITDGITVTADEVRQEFADRNLEAKVRYVSFDKEALAPASPADAELRAHYEKNKEGYRRAEQRRVRYVFVTADATSVQVSEEQIKMRLSSVAPEERVHARHILISAEEGQEAPEARKKAEEILAKLRAGADFAELAKQNSEDPGSAGRGGDLGFFGRGQMTPEFERSAFSLSPGQTSELVRSPFGFHIINVIEKTQQTPEAQRPLVEFELRQEEANRRARAEAFKFVAEVKTGRPMDEAARARKLSVSTSNYFGLGDTLPGMTVRNDFNQKIFALQKGQVLAPYTGSGGFYVAQLDDIKAPQIAPYEEIREQVVREFKSARGEELARERAFAFEGRLKSGSEFEKAAKDANLAVTTTAFFKKGANVDDTLRFSPELHDRAFRMNLGETSPPISVAGKLVVFQLVEKSQLDSAKFEQEKTQIEQDLIQRKRTGVFTAYVQGVVDQLRKDNQIIVNDQTLDSVGG